MLWIAPRSVPTHLHRRVPVKSGRSANGSSTARGYFDDAHRSCHVCFQVDEMAERLKYDQRQAGVEITQICFQERKNCARQCAGGLATGECASLEPAGVGDLQWRRIEG